jgi:hypothetical protein
MTRTTKIRKRILELTEEVAAGKTICPSEVARDLWPDDWRSHMEEVRDVASELQSEGKIEISQKGEVVTPPFTGPIRLKIK